MKTFSPKGRHFAGSLNYIFSISQHAYPTVSISGTQEKDDPITIISNPLTAAVFFSPLNDGIMNVDIDLGRYKVLPSHYELSTAKGGTPPLNFSLLGSNNKNEEWIPIDKHRYNPYLCPYEDGSSDTACKERKINLFPLDTVIGPFRYIRFVCNYNRWELGHDNQRNADLRIGGFEIYGNVYQTNAEIFKQRTCIRKKQHIAPMILFSSAFISK